MEIERSGSQPSAEVRPSTSRALYALTPLFKAPEPARVVGVCVTFEPCARTAWHTHPLGQTLIVMAGCGVVQSWKGAVRKILPRDVIGARSAKLWHGGPASTAMTHIAIVEKLNGKHVDWMEKVTDEQYQAGSSAE
jgi:quercetin dioxygenase-like cupin family protein